MEDLYKAFKQASEVQVQGFREMCDFSAAEEKLIVQDTISQTTELQPLLFTRIHEINTARAVGCSPRNKIDKRRRKARLV